MPQAQMAPTTLPMKNKTDRAAKAMEAHINRLRQHATAAVSRKAPVTNRTAAAVKTALPAQDAPKRVWKVSAEFWLILCTVNVKFVTYLTAHQLTVRSSTVPAALRVLASA